jgi:hypothetical protein
MFGKLSRGKHVPVVRSEHMVCEHIGSVVLKLASDCARGG